MERVRLNNQTILVTGAAGFIGAHLVRRLLTLRDAAGAPVPMRIIGLDNCNDYYDPALKAHRLAKLEAAAAASPSDWQFVRGSIADKALVDRLFDEARPAVVVNLAAQAGVRYSIDHPEAYIESNLIGFYHILEACRHSYDGGKPGVAHLVYASSSSVYGGNRKVPFSVEDPVDHPVSLYAATKKSNELLAHAYSKLYNIPATGLRKCGVAEIDETDRILRMEEKPAAPKSHWCIPPFYYYPRAAAGLIRAGIEAGCGVDAPGSFVAWLSAQTPVYAFEMPGKRYDIGNLAGYQLVQETYKGWEK